MCSPGRLTRTVIRWSAPGISPLFPLLQARGETAGSAVAPGVLEAPEAEEVQVQRLTHRMLPPERMRLKQHQPRQPVGVGAVGVGALLQLELPTRRLKLLSRH